MRPFKPSHPDKLELALQNASNAATTTVIQQAGENVPPYIVPIGHAPQGMPEKNYATEVSRRTLSILSACALTAAMGLSATFNPKRQGIDLVFDKLEA